MDCSIRLSLVIANRVAAVQDAIQASDLPAQVLALLAGVGDLQQGRRRADAPQVAVTKAGPLEKGAIASRKHLTVLVVEPSARF
jgi:hypothetical protein